MFEHLELPNNPTVAHATYFFRGVPIFFALSGFLIWFSIGRSKFYSEYLKKRFWRIYPELWVAVTLEIIVLIILYCEWEIKSLLLFAFGQGTIFQFWTPNSLRGYGVGTPNGALWTIGVMVQFYIIAWFAYKFLKKRGIATWIVGFIISFIASVTIDNVLDQFEIEILSKLYSQTFVKYFWLFYIGIFIAEFKDSVLPILQKYWCALLIVAAIFFRTEFDLYSGYYLFWSLFLVTGLIGFAYKYPQLQIKIDISYGLFLYHMTVVNVFVTFGWIRSWKWALLCVIISLVLAWISTKTVGAWSAKKKNKRRV